MAAVVVAAAVAAATGPWSSLAAADAEVSAGSGGNVFSPASVTIEAGETVTWRFAAANHTATADDRSFDSHPNCSPPLGCSTPGATFRHTFDTPGTYSYRCKVHAGMTGSVNVLSAPSQPAAPEPTTTAPPPSPSTTERVQPVASRTSTTLVNEDSAATTTTDAAGPVTTRPPSTVGAIGTIPLDDIESTLEDGDGDAGLSPGLFSLLVGLATALVLSAGSFLFWKRRALR